MSANTIRRLIETSIPLEAINEASAREKSIRHGHPSTLHLWWARRPLAACRAVLFASLLMDPEDPDKPYHFHDEYPVPDGTRKETVSAERDRLHELIKQLVVWENSNNEDLLAAVRQEIDWHTHGAPPPVLDPFAGGGSIPLEAQRLGLQAFASDLNPVAVLINKALIEIPPRFAAQPPVNPKDAGKALQAAWKGAAGLAADVRFYGQWMRDRAWERIGKAYPTAPTPEGQELTVIAWLWARTVPCENPACQCAAPLIRSFDLSSKKGKERHVEPVVEEENGRPRIRWEVRPGPSPRTEGTVGRKGAVCVACGANLSLDYVRQQARAGNMHAQMTAIVAEGNGGREYLAPAACQEEIARKAVPTSEVPDTDLPEKALGFRVQAYGMVKQAHLFTDRQLLALTTFSDLVQEAHAQIKADGGSEEYATAVATYLAFAVDKLADYNSVICSWHSGRDVVRNTFARQAIPMIWDYTELNVFSESSGNITSHITWIEKVISELPSTYQGHAYQHDAKDCWGLLQKIGADTSVSLNPKFIRKIDEGERIPFMVASSDPPYYDNIGYADLSDFFYVWLRRSLRPYYPELLAFSQTPKTEELIAAPHRHGGDKRKAKEFFEDGMKDMFSCYCTSLPPEQIMTIYYAFKQQESEDDGEASSGWETLLNALIFAADGEWSDDTHSRGFQITGTWPMRTEMANRSVGLGTNALASSIVLVCRPRAAGAGYQTLARFRAELQAELPAAMRVLQQGGIAAVDLPQAAIGPGMAIYSRYDRITDLQGNQLTVRQALKEINAALDASLSGDDLDLDDATRWALAWHRQHGWGPGAFGDADNLARARNTSVQALTEAGLVESGKGKVNLVPRDKLASPVVLEPESVWLRCQLMVRALDEGGRTEAARLWKLFNGHESARQLAYTLFSLSEKRKDLKEARFYNDLIAEWPQIEKTAHELSHVAKAGDQGGLF